MLDTWQMCIFKMEIVEKEKNKSTKNVMSMVVPKLTEMKKSWIL